MIASLPRVGDGPKFRDGVPQFLDRAYNVAYWMVQDRLQAEEIVERSYLRVSEHVQRGELTYHILCRAVIRVSMQTLWFQPPSAESGSEALDPHGPSFVHEPRVIAAAGLLDLAPTIRAAVVLHEVDRLSDGEAAAILDWPVRWVKRAVHAGLRQVQERFAQPVPLGLGEPPQSPKPMVLGSPTSAGSTPSRNGLLSRMPQEFWSKSEGPEWRNLIKQRPSAVGVLAADWEYLTRIAPPMSGDDLIMRLLKLGIGRPNTSDWR